MVEDGTLVHPAQAGGMVAARQPGGSTVDEGWDKAKDVAHDAKNKAKDVAHDAKNKAKDVAHDAKNKAKDRRR